MKKTQISLAIFFLTLSMILVEILYTRVFSVIYYSSFGFLMISLALFGTGLSGVFMSIKKIDKNKNALKYLEYTTLAMAILLPIVFKITLSIKIDFLNLFNPISNLMPLLINVFALLIPFFLIGISLILIFTIYSDEIGKLYFIDLVGAAVGGLLIIPLITLLGPSKIIILVSLVFLLLWLMFTNSTKLIQIFTFALIFIILGGLFKFSEQTLEIVPKISKRDYIKDHKQDKLEYSKWSPINKIDVARFTKNKKIIWLNGGTQQSFLTKQNKRNIRRRSLNQITFSKESIPYQMAKNKGSALIIGSAGGYEALCALSNKFKEIIAVEMDPVICDIVENKYKNYIGDLFHTRGLRLMNDEGRSVLKRLKKKYDIIHMVNSHNSDAILSGGLSIAETYIYTVESFKDYWNNLNEDGFVHIIHIFGERMFTTATQALRELKIKGFEKKFLIIQPTKGGFTHFFMKKGDISKKDIDIVTTFIESTNANLREHGKRNSIIPTQFEIVYSHDRITDSIYYKLVSPEHKDVINNSSVNIAPVYDISPYFNQPNKIGQFSFENNVLKGYGRNAVINNQAYSNSVYLSILLISILLALFLIYLPLKLKSRKDKEKTDFKMVFYFFFIGLAFIIVEIILIKIFQMYLGNPAYSISIIIFALLVSSGIGSLTSKKILGLFKKDSILWISIILVIALIIYSFILFKVVYALIQFSLFVRFAVTTLLIAVVGVPMGVFFPTGLKYLGETNKSLIGWAWGANAFATVLGSVLTLIISINWNFSVAIWIASGFYLIAGLIFKYAQNNK